MQTPSAPCPHFAPHGQFRIQWCDDVLYAALIGTFNEESITQYLNQLKAMGASRQTRWGRFADMRLWQGGTPKAAQMFTEFAQWITSTQCRVSVQYLPSGFRKSIATDTASKLNTKHLYQVCDAESVATILTNYGLKAATLPALLAEPPQV